MAPNDEIAFPSKMVRHGRSSKPRAGDSEEPAGDPAAASSCGGQSTVVPGPHDYSGSRGKSNGVNFSM